MPTLTLTPDRCSPAGSFTEGCFAYCYADRAVRKKGVLITPKALTAQAASDGLISFDLIAASEVDDAESFSYTVAAFDPQGRRMWIGNIVMPDDDVDYWSLIPAPVDLDASDPVAFSCPATTTSESGTTTYCGSEPVGPPFYDGTPFDTEPSHGVIRTSDTVAGAHAEAFSHDANPSNDERYDMVMHAIPEIGNGGNGVGSNGFKVAFESPLRNNSVSFQDVAGFGPYQIGDNSGIIQLGDPRMVVGTVLRIHMIGNWETTGVVHVEEIYTPPATVLDDYNTAKATYDACIAAGGIDGDQP